MRKSRSFLATPPGATIKEQLYDRGLSQKEFALRMSMTEKHISKLINGDVQLTTDVAVRLEYVLGIPAKFWINLEAIYREKIVKINCEKEMDEDIEIAKELPYKEMANNGWIPQTNNPYEKVRNLRKFFEVAQLKTIYDNNINKIACRKLSNSKKSNLALLAWIQQAKLEARNKTTSNFNLKALKSVLPNIRNMTTEKPEIFCSELVNLLSSCGIALIFLPHIEGSFLHGASFIDNNKYIIGITVRGKDADKFWFSLFHEIGHIALNHIKNQKEASSEDEIAADNFAKEILIPTKEFNGFTSKKDFSKSAICSFAQSINIQSGIIVGRLQKEGFINYNCCNDLKTKYTIVK